MMVSFHTACGSVRLAAPKKPPSAMTPMVFCSP
jgi:hypothetical protein